MKRLLLCAALAVCAFGQTRLNPWTNKPDFVAPAGGDSGQVLTKDANGAAIWADPTGPPGAGEANTASSFGTVGVEVVKDKNIVDLRFRKVASASNLLTIALSGDADDYVKLTINPANFDLASFGGITKLPYTQMNFGTQTARYALIAPTSDGTPVFRALATTDILSGTFADARVAQSNVTQHQAALAIAATQVTSGTLDAARLPLPAASAVGGVMSILCSGTDKVSAIGVDGIPVCTTDSTSTLNVVGTNGVTAVPVGSTVTLSGDCGVLGCLAEDNTWGGKQTFTPTAQQTLLTGTAISPDADVVQINAATDITLTSTPTILTAGVAAGRKLTVQVTGSKKITLQDKGTLASSALCLTAPSVELDPAAPAAGSPKISSLLFTYSTVRGCWVQVGSAGASSGGNVVGPGSSTNGNVALFNGTNGQLLQDSAVVGANVVQAAANLTDGAPVCGSGGAKGTATCTPWNPIDTTTATLIEDFHNSWASGTGITNWRSGSLAGVCQTLTNVAGEAGHPGIFRMQLANSTAANLCGMDMTGASSNGKGFAVLSSGWTAWETKMVFRLDTATITDQYAYVGWASFPSDPLVTGASAIILAWAPNVTPTCGVGSASSTHLMYIVRSGSSNTCYDSGVTPAANTWYTMRVSSSSAGTATITVAANGGSFTGAQDITVPSVAMSPIVQLGQPAVGSPSQRTLDVDFFSFWGKGLTR